MGLAPLQGKRAQSLLCPLVDTVRRWRLQGEGARPDLPAPGPPPPASRAAGERCAQPACCSSSPRRLRRPLNFSETNPAASYPPCLRISWRQSRPPTKHGKGGFGSVIARVTHEAHLSRDRPRFLFLELLSRDDKRTDLNILQCLGVHCSLKTEALSSLPSPRHPQQGPTRGENKVSVNSLHTKVFS